MRVAIVAANTFEHDARLLRTARALADDGHVVTLVAFAAPGLPASEELAERLSVRRVSIDRRVTSAFRPLPGGARAALARILGFPPDATSLPPGLPRGLVDRVRAPVPRLVEIVAHQRRVGPWRDAVLGAVPDADVYHCKALVALPVVAGAAARARAMARAGAAARTGRVERDGAVERVGTAARAGPPPGAEAAAPTRGRALFAYDLADLHTEAARIARMPRPIRALVRGREARWVRAASLRFAVSDGVAREAARRFHVPEPVVVLNCPPAWHPEDPGPPASDRIREATGIAPNRPIVLYQGGFSVDRGIEELIGALDEPGMRTLDPAVVLLGYGRLREGLVAEAAARPGRLFVVDAVPPGELLAWTASADIGFVGQPPRTLNQRLNLANKLFESIMSGLPVVVAEGTEHCRVTRAEGLGTCCRIEPLSIASAVAQLLGASPHERAALRSHVRSVALERYTWERQQRGLVEAYRSIARETGAE